LADYEYASLDFTETFLETYASGDFSKADRAQFKKALRLLDRNERHPSLRIHPLHGDQEGAWAAYASEVLRLTFERRPGGRKRLLTCSQHYDR
jgi:hypothetical protein